MSDIGEMPESARVNRELVRLLESALSDAKAGRVVAGGVVAVLGPSSFVAFAAMSSFPGEVIAGCQVMTSDLIAKMREPRRSPIMRAGAIPQMNGGH